MLCFFLSFVFVLRCFALLGLTFTCSVLFCFDLLCFDLHIIITIIIVRCYLGSSDEGCSFSDPPPWIGVWMEAAAAAGTPRWMAVAVASVVAFAGWFQGWRLLVGCGSGWSWRRDGSVAGRSQCGSPGGGFRE